MRSPSPPVRLRNGVEIADPLRVVLGYLESWRFETGDLSASFSESDLRRANRAGARISAAEIEAVLGRRRAIGHALRAIDPATSLTASASVLPWAALRRLFAAFADIRGVGFSKMTKALHPKRPALIPMLDSVVQSYLQDETLERDAPFAEQALVLVRGYKRDLDGNDRAMRAIRKELARRGHAVSEVRILDLLIWSVVADPEPTSVGGPAAEGAPR